MIFWLYIDEYCSSQWITNYCAIIQHLTFNNTHLTPEIFLNPEGSFFIRNKFNYSLSEFQVK
jgi:hypothetical protein